MFKDLRTKREDDNIVRRSVKGRSKRPSGIVRHRFTLFLFHQNHRKTTAFISYSRLWSSKSNKFDVFVPDSPTFKINLAFFNLYYIKKPTILKHRTNQRCRMILITEIFLRFSDNNKDTLTMYE